MRNRYQMAPGAASFTAVAQLTSVPTGAGDGTVGSRTTDIWASALLGEDAAYKVENVARRQRKGDNCFRGKHFMFNLIALSQYTESPAHR